MSILIDENTKLLIQGITGGFGGKHAQLSLDYGTKVVGGITPGKGGHDAVGVVMLAQWRWLCHDARPRFQAFIACRTHMAIKVALPLP